MADVYDYITDTGVIVPDAAEILSEVEQEYKDIFGSDLITTPNTPQGALIVSETAARTAVADNNANLANQINPHIAGGIFLDAILALTGQQRFQGSPTLIINATVTGVPGTLIPQGSLAKDTVNQVNFETITGVTLDSGGNGTVSFQTLDNTAVSVAPGTLTIIVSAVLGWETVTNPTASQLGQPKMSDADARLLRYNTLFAQGSSLAGAIMAAVLNVPHVQSMSLLENITSSTTTVEGVTMVAHSIYMCINGAYDNLAVAQAITSRKSGGCDYNNGASGTPISQPVTSPFSGQTINVLWDKPDNIAIYVIVNCSKGMATSPDLSGAITDAVNAYFATLQVWGDVSAFEIAGAVLTAVPGLFLTSVFIGTAPSPTGSTTISINPWEIATVGNVTVNIT